MRSKKVKVHQETALTEEQKGAVALKIARKQFWFHGGYERFMGKGAAEKISCMANKFGIPRDHMACLIEDLIMYSLGRVFPKK